MNIRRYMAKDMRTAFKLVRDELGPEVVILSTRRVKGQIELTVASERNPMVEHPSTAVREVSFPSLAPRAAAAVAAPPPVMSSTITPPPVVAPQRAAPLSEPVRVANVASAVDDELRALRRLLETQLAALSWNDMSRRSPVVAELLRELTAIGFRREFATELLESIDERVDLGTARRRVHAALARRIQVTGDLWAEQGGTVAVVGPAGAGKTTALAALAARWVMRNGTQGAALISVGESRFGVQENLARLGRLVGIAVYVLDKISELPTLLQRLGDRRMILIDTAGCSPRSANFERHIRELRDTLPNAQFALALSASTQVGTLREVVTGYRGLGNLAGIVTHTDECTTLGGLLSATIEAGIPIAYTLDGQRLLDDLRPARAEVLVDLTFALAESEQSREEQDSTIQSEARLHGS
jgi:flagellar biosynthesis protein FlhF